MTGYVHTPLALPFALTTLVVISVGVSILLHERFSRVGWLQFFLSFTVGCWQASVGVSMLSNTPALDADWMRLATLFALFIPALQLQFAFVITGRWSKQRRWSAAVWIATGLLVALLPTQWFSPGDAQYRWGGYPQYGPVGWAFIALLAGVVMACLRLYWRVHRDNALSSHAERRGFLLFCSLAVGAFGALDFLPALGVGLFPLGGLAAMMSNLINAYTTWRYRLIEITPAYAADQLMDSMSDGVLLIDRDGVVRLVNPAACEILGMDRAALLHRLPPDALAGPVLDWNQLPFFPSADASTGEKEYTTPDGSRRVLDVTVSLMREHGLEPGAAVITLRDITVAVQAQEQIQRLAYYDSLTHLPNRLLLRERFGEAIARAKRSHGMAATLFMDLDRFKQVNDTLGHDAGDQLLKSVAERITGCVRETDWLLRNAHATGASTLARLGGDEFVLLLSPIERPEDAAKVAARILEVLSRPVVLKRGAEVATGASIGISVYPHDGDDAEELMKKADLAMYQAKENGRNNYRFYDDALNSSALARTDLENRLRRGLVQSEFLLQYQPLAEARTGELAGVEAQLYLRHPQNGIVPATDLICASDDTALMEPLAQWMLITACKELRTWRDQAAMTLRMVTSLPPSVIERGELPRLVGEALACTGVEPGALMLTLPSATARDPARATAAMDALSAHGVRLVLDELGAGYRPLADLRRLRGGVARFSSSFLRSLAAEGDQGGIARPLFALAHSLNLSVLVTGVENNAQAAFLREMGCDLAQGPYFGPALAAADVPALLAMPRQELVAS